MKLGELYLVPMEQKYAREHVESGSFTFQFPTILGLELWQEAKQYYLNLQLLPPNKVSASHELAQDKAGSSTR